MSVAAAVNVRMGELAIATDGQLTTLLGSCVGIILYDRRRRIGGLAHTVLPNSRGDDSTPGKFVDTAIAALLAGFRGDGVHDRVGAKLVGGAEMLAVASEATVGAQNIAAAESLLVELGIPVLGRHCGGKQGRRVAFDIATGRVTVRQVGIAGLIEI